MLWWDNLRLGLAVTPLRGLFFSEKEMKEEWRTRDCIIVCPIVPWFAKPFNFCGATFYPIDVALSGAKEIVRKERSLEIPSREDRFKQLRKTLPCKIELVTSKQLSSLDRSPYKHKTIHHAVTIKGWRNTRILTNKFIREWIGHELLHWAEWYFWVDGNESFAYNYESFVGSLLDETNARRYLSGEFENDK